MLQNKFLLGGAQIGLNYGINNSVGKPQLDEVSRILTTVENSGFAGVDTASVYGDSELRIGQCLSNDSPLKIFTKIKDVLKTDLIHEVKNSLSNLSVSSVEGLYFHDFSEVPQLKNIHRSIQEVRSQNLANKIGVSVYFPHQAEFLLENSLPFDLIQFPYNILDRRFDTVIPKLKLAGYTVVGRSIFLQGLLLMDTHSIPKKLEKVRGILDEIDSAAKKFNLSRYAALLNFILSRDTIDYWVIGIDSISQIDMLNQHISLYKNNDSLNQILSEFAILDESIILPMNWNA